MALLEALLRFLDESVEVVAGLPFFVPKVAGVDGPEASTLSSSSLSESLPSAATL